MRCPGRRCLPSISWFLSWHLQKPTESGKNVKLMAELIYILWYSETVRLIYHAQFERRRLKTPCTTGRHHVLLVSLIPLAILSLHNFDWTHQGHDNFSGCQYFDILCECPERIVYYNSTHQLIFAIQVPSLQVCTQTEALVLKPCSLWTRSPCKPELRGTTSIMASKYAAITVAPTCVTWLIYISP